ncbi:hypothetical protein [Ruegeria arenilitoris]|uniref:hypothetical protein n=1 Tax=Ruegeria arenilitoris TaxID=1173585 RepID=UPI001C2CA32C|nr:hypothetical protein [Ruegeria arenilitoris]
MAVAFKSIDGMGCRVICCWFLVNASPKKLIRAPPTPRPVSCGKLSNNGHSTKTATSKKAMNYLVRIARHLRDIARSRFYFSTRLKLKDISGVLILIRKTQRLKFPDPCHSKTGNYSAASSNLSKGTWIFR